MDVLSPVTNGFETADHTNVVLLMFEVRFRLTKLPLQIESVAALVVVGFGLTITLTVCCGPLQPLALGTIV